jgi:AraC family transcriptional regulator
MDEKKLHRVLTCIDARLPESIRVDELAAEAQMSPFHFARMFKKAVGHPPHAYITQLRMERAKTLLAEGKMSLRDIARNVGFQTQAHFSGVFHKRVGMTPRTYRLRHQGEGQATPAKEGFSVPVQRPEAVQPAAAHALEASRAEPS